MADPIHQFEIKELIPLELNNIETNISYTNSSIFMSLAIIFVTYAFDFIYKEQKVYT